MIEKKEKKGGIVKNLINLVGVTAGIILMSIGAITFFNVFLQNYVFGVDGERYGYERTIEERCDMYNPDKEELNEAMKKLGTTDPRYMPVEYVATLQVKDKKEKKDKIKEKLTENEKKILKDKYNKCLADEKTKDERRIKNNNGRQMAWGLAFLIVGTPILWFYHRRRED